MTVTLNTNPISLDLSKRVAALEAPAEEKTKVKADQAEVVETKAKTFEAKAKVHVCPGHTDLYHRFLRLARAEKKANKEVEKMRKDEDIKSAKFKIITKKEEPSCGWFRGLNKIYKCAALIVYKHTDDSTKCPHHPEYKA